MIRAGTRSSDYGSTDGLLRISTSIVRQIVWVIHDMFRIDIASGQKSSSNLHGLFWGSSLYRSY